MNRHLPSALAAVLALYIAPAWAQEKEPAESAKGESADAKPEEKGEGKQADGEAKSDEAAKEPTLKEEEDPAAQARRDRQLADLLIEREKYLNAREAELEGEEQRLNELRSRIEARYQELEALRRTLDGRMAGFRTELAERRDEQVAKLVKAMAGMPPESAATMAAKMDEGLIVRVFDRMKARNVAAVFAAMPAPLAASVGQRLALYRSGTRDKAEKKQ